MPRLGLAANGIYTQLNMASGALRPDWNLYSSAISGAQKLIKLTLPAL